MKVLLLILSMFVFWGCFTEEFNAGCSSDSGNFGHDVLLTKYYAFDRYFYNGVYEKNTTLTFSATSKVVLDLRKDSVFSKIVIDSLNDTLEIQNGHFSIHKMPYNDWIKKKEAYSFALTVDSTMKKWRVNERNEIEKIDSVSKFYESEVNNDSLLLNVSVDDSCFVLADFEIDDMYCNDKYFIRSSRKFCANAFMRDSSIINK